jgi:hypothetical protein
MNKRNSETQKLINDGIVWKNEITNRWERHCPSCKTLLSYKRDQVCFAGVRQNSKCLKCCNVENYRGYPKTLIDSKVIWEDASGWHRKCPKCFDELTYGNLDRCVYSEKHKWMCLSCSKAGSNHPRFGKQLDQKSKDKIRKSNIGKHVCSDAYRKRLSKSQLQSKNNYFIKNGGIAGFRWKSYTMPDGRVVKIQGHENHTLDLLLQYFPSEDIKVSQKEKPVIDYEWSGSLRKYFPDCFIPSQNLLIETKSPWTWEYQQDRNLAKISGSLSQGFNVRLIIWKEGKIHSDTYYSASGQNS